ncbi:MAG: Ig-like domain-containing protein [Lachnospiraceae bacterium]|nr:Ig-like domain-containing protein [Lachnospiraceae bacterium]
MKKFFRTALFMMIMLFVFTSPISLSGASGVITAEAATTTSVKSLTVGKSYTVSGYAKVTSSNTKVATAKKKSSSKYTIKGVKKGSVTLKCYNSSGKLVKKIYLIVVNSSSFKYNTSTVTLTAGKSKTVTATVQSGCTVKYSSSKKSVATVNSKGKITAKKAGTTTISVKVYYKGTKIKTLTKTVKVKSAVPTLTMSFDTSAITLSPGKTATAKATVTSGYTVSYSSSDTSVATVSSSGIITGVAGGTATITVKASYNGTVKKTVTKKVTVRSYKLSASTLSVVDGKTATLKCTTSDGGYSSSDSFVWSSSDSSIVSVSGSGHMCTVTGEVAGTAKVTCKVNGKVSLKCTVTVTAPALSVSYDTSAISLAVGETKTCAATATDKYTVSYSSSNSSVVTVTSTGKIMAAGTGTATITVTVSYNGAVKKTLTKSVTVEPPTLTVTYDSSAITISPGKTVTTTASVTSGYTVAYSSSDTSVATVSSSGVITGASGGETTITVKVSYNGAVKKSLTKSVAVRTYNLSSTTLSLDKGDAVTLRCSTSGGEYSSSDTFTWSSSSTSVATVSGSGYSATITGVAAGTATITCTVNSTVSFTCTVTVVESFINHVSTSSISVAGGSGKAISVYRQYSTDTVTFELNNDCAQVTSITDPTLFYDDYNSMNAYYTKVTLYGRKQGSCSLYIYVDGELLKTIPVTVTSTDDDYYTYQSWKESLKSDLWKSSMSDLQKIVVFGDYVFNTQTYTLNQPGYYGYAYNYGGDCYAAAYLLVDLATDLGYEAEVFNPYVASGNYNHAQARIWIGSNYYDMEATNSTSNAYGTTRVWKNGILIYDPAVSGYETLPD